MPPVKQDWKLIAETALKDAASAEARLTAANNALDGFRAEVAAALVTLEAALRPDLFRTPEFYQAAMEIIEITQEQLGLAPGKDKANG